MKAIVIVQLFPTARVAGQRLTATNSLEFPPCTIEMRGSLMVTGAVPMLVTVMFFVVMLPRFTVPKAMLDGETVTNGPFAFTVCVTVGAAE